jgi:hypothetical protein
LLRLKQISTQAACRTGPAPPRLVAMFFEDNLHDQSTRRHTSDQTFTLHTRL